MVPLGDKLNPTELKNIIKKKEKASFTPEVLSSKVINQDTCIITKCLSKKFPYITDNMLKDCKLGGKLHYLIAK